MKLIKQRKNIITCRDERCHVVRGIITPSQRPPRKTPVVEKLGLLLLAA